jgi:hypothetical protein
MLVLSSFNQHESAIETNHIQSSTDRYYGTLMSDTSKTANQVAHGINCVSLTVSWNAFEPQEGVVSETYALEIEKKLNSFKRSGANVVLDFGMHYPPGWVTQVPNSRYVNQYGDAYILAESGRNVVNGVFNKTIREKMASYIGKVFNRFGAENFFAVRVGGGYWAELHYPDNQFNSKSNCYWGYDAIAKNEVPNMLPEGISPNPVSDWKPGQSSANNESARQFINWYIGALSNYQNFQIATIRQHFSGLLNILYADWSVRPGQIEEAIATNLDGSSFAEFYGQLQKGHAPQQHIEALPEDANLVAYTTSFNSVHPWSHDINFVNESSTNPNDWSPVHFISWLANNQNPKLKVWGENSGNNPYSQMQLIFQRINDYGAMGVMWAFESSLYSSNPEYANLSDFISLITLNAPAGTTNVYENSEVDIFPNPTKDLISITSVADLSGKSYCIYDNMGREIVKGNFTAGSDIIHLNFLKNGMYFLQIDSFKALKFIKH